MRKFGWCVALILTCGLGNQAQANIAPDFRGNLQAGNILVPPSPSDLEVQKEHLTIKFSKGKPFHTPAVTITAEYVIFNPTTHDIDVATSFPWAGQLEPITYRGAGVSSNPSEERDPFSVTLDDRRLNVRMEKIEFPEAERDLSGYAEYPRHLYPSDISMNGRAMEIFADWLNRNPKVAVAAQTYREEDVDYSAAYRDFDIEAKKALTELGSTYDVYEYLSNPRDWQRIRAIMPQVSAAYRVPVRDGYFDNALPKTEPDASSIAKYQQEIDAWFNKYPAIRTTFAELGRQRAAHGTAEKKLREHAGPALLQLCNGDHDVVERFLKVLMQGYSRQYRSASTQPDGSSLPRVVPSLVLMGKVDPALEKERLLKVAEADKLLAYYGFDDAWISPITGKPYRYRMGRWDESAWAHLQLDPAKAPKEGETRLVKTCLCAEAAHQLLFDLHVPAGQTSVLKVTYETICEADGYAWPTDIRLPQFRYILTTTKYWKKFGPIDVEVTVPEGIAPVISPCPPAAKVMDGNQVFRWTIEKPDDNLRVALVYDDVFDRLRQAPRSYGLFPSRLDSFYDGLQNLLPSVTHPQAKAVVEHLLNAGEGK